MKHIFDKCKSVVAKFAKGGELTEVYGRFAADSKALLSDIVDALHEALIELFDAHISNNGTIEYSEKDYSYINDNLDYLAIKYYDEAADGDYQEELENDGEPMIDAQQAYMEIATRFENTYIDTDDLKFEKGSKSIKDVNDKLRGALIITLKAYSGNGGYVAYSKDVYDSAKKLLAEINSGKLTDGEAYTKLTEFFSQEFFGALDKIKKFEAGGSLKAQAGQIKDLQKLIPNLKADSVQVIAEGGNDNGETFNGSFLAKVGKVKYRITDGKLVRKF